VIHANLCIDESFTNESIQELIEYIDEEIVAVVGVSRDECTMDVMWVCSATMSSVETETWEGCSTVQPERFAN
jgi:hypothetical protein